MINLFIATFLLSLTSCGQKASHQQAIDYITSIGTQMLDSKSKIETFWDEMKSGMLTARQSSNHQLDKPQVDTLQNHLDTIVADINSKIQKLKAISEVDKDLNLKDRTIAYLTEARQLQENAIPVILQLLTNGLDKITDEQRVALKNFMEEGGKMQQESIELQNAVLDYYKKYNITDEEINKNGL